MSALDSTATPSDASDQPIDFPPFRIDRRRGCLVRNDRAIALRPKTWEVLCYLAQRPGVLVSKGELLDAVWDGVVVGEDTLSKSISEIRVALGDDARAPRFVETVHRRGFRFIARISPKEDAEPIRQAAESRNGAVDIVGRAAETERLQRALDEAAQGQRQLLFVTGEPGIGKTALVSAFARSLAGSAESGEIWVASGGAVGPVTQPEPYYPVLEALDRLARIVPQDLLVERMRRVAPTWLVQLPWLLQADDADELRAALGEVHPQRMLREFAALVEELTQHGTLVMILEDLHWSDTATVDLLSILAQRPEKARLLVVATFRPAEVAITDHPLATTRAQLRSRRLWQEMALPFLKVEVITQYLERRFPGATFVGELSALLHRQTDGNPLFIEAVLDQLLMRGWIVHTDPGWALTVPLDRLQLDVWEDLREMIRSHLESLPPSDRALIERAAVAGIEFDPEDLMHANLTREGAESACMRLARAHHLLMPCATDSLRQHHAKKYGFVHALCRQAIYDEIPESRRCAVHGEIGAHLEARLGNQAAARASELATHFRLAGDFKRAVSYLARSADRARLRFSPREAAACLTSALELIPSLDDADERARRELEIRLALGNSAAAIHGYAADEVRENCEVTLALAEQRAAPAILYRALYALWYSQGARAEPSARETAERLVDLGQRAGSADLVLQAKILLGRTAFHEGMVAEAHDLLAGALSPPFDSEIATTTDFGVAPLVGAESHCGFALWHLGFPDQARQRIRRSRAIADAIADPVTTISSRLQEVYLEAHYGRHQLVLELAERAVALMDEEGLPFFRGLANALYGWAMARTGSPSGIDRIEGAIGELRDAKAIIWLPHLLSRLADAHLANGNLVAATQAVDQGLEIAESTIDRIDAPELWRLRGAIAAAEADTSTGTAAAVARLDEAERCFERARTLAQQRSSKAFELRAANELARLHLIRDRSSAALRAIEPLLAGFEEGGDYADLKTAQALCERARSATRSENG